MPSDKSISQGAKYFNTPYCMLLQSNNFCLQFLAGKEFEIYVGEIYDFGSKQHTLLHISQMSLPPRKIKSAT